MGQNELDSVLTRTIAYKPLKSQLKFHECTARYKVLSGPVGSGKTSSFCQEALRMAIMNPGCLGLIGAPTYPILRDTTQREFFRILEENKIPYELRKTDKEVVIKDTQSHIIFRTLDDPERLIGINLAWFGIDELAYCKEWAFLRLQARLREPAAKVLCGFGATTPNGLNWVYDRFLAEKKTDQFEMIKSVPGENVYLPPDFYATLAASYDERFYRQEVLGEYLALQSGTVYHAFERERNIDPIIEFNPRAELVWSLDFNVDPMCSILAQIVDFAPTELDSSQQTRKIEVLNEIAIRDGSIDLACADFLKKTHRYLRANNLARLHVKVYGDPAGHARGNTGETSWGIVRNFFASQPRYHMEWLVADSHPAIVDRVNSVNALLYDARHETRMTISPKCKGLIKDLERVTWKKDSAGNSLGVESQSDKLLTHLSAALGYFVAEAFSAARITSKTFHARRLF